MEKRESEGAMLALDKKESAVEKRESAVEKKASAVEDPSTDRDTDVFEEAN